ncbi:ATPase, T2SS/T4P/T4SS family [Pantanalinema rosaneae CENA516]|uniref:ATPase, T2SS/T4P/T4SS family n=1 Tax=Pantanalinema rosaneae TaxID=1620701 RepID=UPI003D6F3777
MPVIPSAGSGISTFTQLLQAAKAHHCSDLHIRIGRVPYWRINGTLQAIALPETDIATFWQWADEVFSIEAIQQLQAGTAVSTVVEYHFAKVAVQGYLTLDGAALSVRFLLRDLFTIDQLGIPTAIKQLCQQPQGLIIVTGTSGSGTTTTLAALVNYINQILPRHIVTIDETAGYVYPKHQALIDQWLIGTHVTSTTQGIHRAMQTDSDVIVLSQLRDRSTVDLALQAARSGNLVLACMAADRAIVALQELFSFYSSLEQDFIRLRLAQTLHAILAQHLVPTLNGQYKRAAIFDFLFTTDLVRQALRQGELDNLSSLLQRPSSGLRSMLNDLNRLLTEERITAKTFADVSQQLALEAT